MIIWLQNLCKSFLNCKRFLFYMLSACFFHCWRVIFALHSHPFFLLLGGYILILFPCHPFSQDSYTMFSESPGCLGENSSSLTLKSSLTFPPLADFHFLVLHEDTLCHRDSSSSAMSLAIGNPTILYYREALTASKKILPRFQTLSAAIRVPPLGME